MANINIENIEAAIENLSMVMWRNQCCRRGEKQRGGATWRRNRSAALAIIAVCGCAKAKAAISCLWSWRNINKSAA
jgi:hypothetical protein